MPCDFSIILPVYNLEKYIARCLSTILQQSFCNFELIVVNDGSTDQTISMTKQLLSAAPFPWKIVEQQNAGLASARNTGLEHANGKYIVFIDGDDYLEPDFLTNLFTVGEETNADVLIVGFDRIEDAGEVLSTEMVWKEQSILTYPELFDFIPFINTSVWNKAFKKSMVGNIRFNEENVIAQDVYFTVSMLIKAKKVAFVPRVLYHYIVRNSSLNMATVHLKDRLTCIDFAIQDLIRFLKNEGKVEQFWDVLCMIGILHIGININVKMAAAGGNLQQSQKETKNYLDKNLPGWYKNRFFRWSVIRRGPKYFFIMVTAWLLRLGIIGIFVYPYNWMIQNFHRDVKW